MMPSSLRWLGLAVLVFAVGCSDSPPKEGPPEEPQDAGSQDDAVLSSLTLSAGSLSPAFTPALKQYTGEVDPSVESLTVTATAGVAGAQLFVNEVPVASGAASQPIALADLTDTLITVVVRTPANKLGTYHLQVERPRQQAYVKAADSAAGFSFGASVALTADGNTLVVGASNGASGTRPVSLLTRSGTTWTQQTSVQSDSAHLGDAFGYRVAVSADGRTLAVAAPTDYRGSKGVNAGTSGPLVFESGAVHVFVLSDGTWRQQAYIKATNTGTDDRFGLGLALSADGNTLAVGAPREDSSATGLDGDPEDNGAADSGAVYVLTRSSGVWSHHTYVKASNTGAGDEFGSSVSLSGDGRTLVVGAPGEDSSATGIEGNQADNGAEKSGAAYLFSRGSGGTWSQRAYFKAYDASADDAFGISVALSADGSTLVAGAERAEGNGGVYIFTHEAGALGQQAHLRAFNGSPVNRFGNRVALSGDGNLLVVGALSESTGNVGVNNNTPNAPLVASSGAAYVLRRTGFVWGQGAYLKASNPGTNDEFGTSLAVSEDGSALAVGAPGEASSARGIGGNQADDSAANSGAVYVFGR